MFPDGPGALPGPPTARSLCVQRGAEPAAAVDCRISTSN